MLVGMVRDRFGLAPGSDQWGMAFWGYDNPSDEPPDFRRINNLELLSGRYGS